MHNTTNSYAVIPKLPKFNYPRIYNPQTNMDPSAYYTKALGFLPIDTRYMVNTTNSLAYNSMADVLFNNAAHKARWDNSDTPWMDDWWATPLRLVADTGLLLKDTIWDPIANGVTEDGWSGLTRGASTALMNTLVNIGNTLDIVSNPIKGLVLEGGDGFVKGLVGDENGRKQYDYMDYVDTGNGVTNLITSVVLELVSDPLTWASFGTAGAAKGAAKTSVQGVTGGIRTTLKNVVEAGTSSVDDVAEVLVKDYSKFFTKDTAKSFVKQMTNQSGQVTVKAIDDVIDVTDTAITNYLTRAAKQTGDLSENLIKIAEDLSTSTKTRYTASKISPSNVLFGQVKRQPLTQSQQHLVSAYLKLAATDTPDLINNSFRNWSKAYKTSEAFQRGLLKLGGGTIYAPYKTGKIVHDKINNAAFVQRAKQDKIIKTFDSIQDDFHFDSSDPELIEAIKSDIFTSEAGLSDAAVTKKVNDILEQHSKTFDNLLHLKDRITKQLGAEFDSVQSLKEQLVKLQKEIVVDVDKILSTLNQPGIKTLDDYIAYFKKLGDVGRVPEHVKSLEYFKDILNTNFKNTNTLSRFQTIAKQYQANIKKTMRNGQADSIKAGDDALDEWRTLTRTIYSNNNKLNARAQNIDEVLEVIESDTFNNVLIPAVKEALKRNDYTHFSDSFVSEARHAVSVNSDAMGATGKAGSSGSFNFLVNELTESYTKYTRHYDALDAIDRIKSTFNPEDPVLASSVKEECRAVLDYLNEIKFKLDDNSITSVNDLLKNLDDVTYLLQKHADIATDDLMSQYNELVKYLQDQARFGQYNISRAAESNVANRFGVTPLTRHTENSDINTNTLFYKHLDTEPDELASVTTDDVTRMIEDLPLFNAQRLDAIIDPELYQKYKLVTYTVHLSKTRLYHDLFGIGAQGDLVYNNSKMLELIQQYKNTDSDLHRLLNNKELYSDEEWTNIIEPMRDLFSKGSDFRNLSKRVHKFAKRAYFNPLQLEGLADQLVTITSRGTIINADNVDRIVDEMLDGMDMYVRNVLQSESVAMDHILSTVAATVKDLPEARAILASLKAGKAHDAVTDVNNWIRLLNIADASDHTLVKGFKQQLLNTAKGRYIVVFDMETIGTKEATAIPFQISGKVLDPNGNVVPGLDFNFIIKPPANRMPDITVLRKLAPEGQDPIQWWNTNIMGAVDNKATNTYVFTDLKDAIGSFATVCKSKGPKNFIVAGQNITKFDMDMLSKLAPKEAGDIFNNVDVFDSLNHFNLNTFFQFQGGDRAAIKLRLGNLLLSEIGDNNKALNQVLFSHYDLATLSAFNKLVNDKHLLKAVSAGPTPTTANLFNELLPSGLFDSLTEFQNIKLPADVINNTPSKSVKFYTVTVNPALRTSEYISKTKQLNEPYLKAFKEYVYATEKNSNEAANIIKKAEDGLVEIKLDRGFNVEDSAVFKQNQFDFFKAYVNFDFKHENIVDQLQQLIDAAPGIKEFYQKVYRGTVADEMLAQLDEYIAKVELFKNNYIKLFYDTPVQSSSVAFIKTSLEDLNKLADEIIRPYKKFGDVLETQRIREGLGYKQTKVDVSDLENGNLGQIKADNFNLNSTINEILDMWKTTTNMRGKRYITVTQVDADLLNETMQEQLSQLAKQGLLDVAPGTNIMQYLSSGVRSGRIVINPHKAMSYEVADIFDLNKALQSFEVSGQKGVLATFDMERMTRSMFSIKKIRCGIYPKTVQALEKDAREFIDNLVKLYNAVDEARKVLKISSDELAEAVKAYKAFDGVSEQSINIVEDLAQAIVKHSANTVTAKKATEVITQLMTTPTNVRYVKALREGLDAPTAVAVATYYYRQLPADNPLVLNKKYAVFNKPNKCFEQYPELYVAAESKYNATPVLHKAGVEEDSFDYMFEEKYFNYEDFVSNINYSGKNISFLNRYNLDRNIYNVGDAAIHALYAEYKPFADRVIAWLDEVPDARMHKEQLLRNVGNILDQQHVRHILTRENPVEALKAEARVRASRTVFHTRKRVDLSMFEADADLIVKSNIKNADGSYTHVIYMKTSVWEEPQKIWKAAQDAEQAGKSVEVKPLSIRPYMFKSIEGIDETGMALLEQNRSLQGVHVHNIGYSRGDIVNKQLIDDLDKTLISKGILTEAEIAEVPSVGQLMAADFFDDLNANNSIIGGYAFRKELFGDDAYCLADPFKQTLRNYEEAVVTKNTQLSIFLGVALNKYNNINADYFTCIPPEDFAKFFDDNSDMGLYYVMNSEVTKSKFELKEFKVVNAKSIETARKYGTVYVLPRTQARQIMATVNTYKLPKLVEYARDISNTFKIGFLTTTGWIVRNIVDTHYKTHVSLYDSVSIPKQITHYFETLKLDMNYVAIGQQYTALVNKTFSSDLEYLVFYRVCKNFDKAPLKILDEVTQGLSDANVVKAKRYARRVLDAANEAKVDLTTMQSKLIEPDLFTVIDVFYRTGPNSGLPKAIKNGIVNPGADSGEARITNEINKWIIEKSPARYIFNANEVVERSARLSMFLLDLERGSTIDTAIKNIIKTHFDYSDKSLAMIYTEILFPFMSFSYKNLDFWVDTLAHNPLIAGELENILRPILNYNSLFDPNQEAYEAYDYTFDWSKDVTSFQANAPWAMINAARLYHILNGNIVIDTGKDVMYDNGYGTKESDLYAVFKLSPSVLDAVKLLYNPLNTYSSRLLPPAETISNIFSGLAEGKDVADQLSTAELVNMLPFFGVMSQRLGIGANNNIVKRVEDAGPLMLAPSIFGAAYVPQKDQMYYYDSDYNILGGFKSNYYAKRNYNNPYNSSNPSYTITRLARKKNRPKDIYRTSKRKTAYDYRYNSLVNNMSDRILKYRIRDYSRYY